VGDAIGFGGLNVFGGGGVRGGGRPSGFGGGGFVSEDFEVMSVGRSGRDFPFPFSDGVGGFDDPSMTTGCCSCESLKGDKESEGW
jgi:hypothetical protein